MTIDKDKKYLLEQEIETARLSIEANKVNNDSQKIRLQGYELIYKYARIVIILLIINILLWTDTVSNSEFLQWIKKLLGM